MASGETTSGTLADSLPSILADARIIREHDGTWQRTTDKRTLSEGTGLNWQEISLAQLTSSDITEITQNENAQQIADTLLQSEPTMTQILIKVTDRTYRKIADVVESKMGTLAGNAMMRKKNNDYLSLFSSFSGAADPGANNPLSFGHISAAVNRIKSNTTEPSTGTIHTILHGFQIKDIQDELLAGVGTYNIPNGITEETFRKGFSGTVAGSNVWEDGNITIDGSDDAIGAVHAQEGVVAVSGMTIKTETRRDPAFGGGADEVFMTDEYSFVERSSSNWAYGMTSDALAPTS